MVDRIREFYPQEKIQGHPYYVHIVLHALMTCLAKLQTLWHHKAWLTDAQAEEAKGVEARLEPFWQMLTWKRTVRVHWAAAHIGFYMERYRSIYLFSNIPTELRNSRFKVELRNRVRGWSVRRPLLNRRGLKHVVNMHVLDLGLAICDAKEGPELPKTKRTRM